MVSAISIILVNVFWRSSAGSASPVTRLSEMVSSASAFLPAAAAFRYSAAASISTHKTPSLARMDEEVLSQPCS